MTTVRIDDHGVSRRVPDGGEERVRWDELSEVAIVTTDEGPLGDDVFFVLTSRDGSGCVIAQHAADEVGLLERLQRLAGFDNELFIASMSSTRRARFVVWRAPV